MLGKTNIETTVITLAIGAAGALAGRLLALPAPYLIGPALSVTIVSLSGIGLDVPQWLRNVCFVVIGLSMGAGITPQVFVAARTWPSSFLLLIPAIAVIFWVAYFVLRRIYAYDRLTALLAASPGHLSFIVSLAAEGRGDMASVSIIQSVRVLALTLLVPVVVNLAGLATPAPAVPPASMALWSLATCLALAALVGLVFRRLRFPAALLIGGVAVSGVGHITQWVEGGLPAWMTLPTYVVLGCVIGSRFSGVPVLALRKAFLAGAVVTLVVTALAALMSVVVSALTGVPINAVFIAFSPGGVETMAAMAVIMHVDATYVGAHHVMRLLFLSVFMPYVMARADRRPG